jgi:hypothetical protein
MGSGFRKFFCNQTADVNETLHWVTHPSKTTMPLTYTVRGADGKDYGPATLEQITAWVREGRVRAQQDVRRSDMEHWSAAANFTELQSAFPPAATVPSPIAPSSATQSGDPVTERQMKSGASWFYWIAGLSLVNSIAAFSGGSWRFILGLGITQILDALGNEFGGAGRIVVLMLDLIVAGMFVLFGVFAHKRHTWAFVTGMVLFALDGVVFLIAQDWLGVGFHVFVLYCFFRGLKACRELNAA